MLRIKINLSKVDEAAIFNGKNGARYLDLVVWENRDGVDQYGNSHRVDQDIGQDRRKAGEKAPILGNGKTFGSGAPSGKPAPARPPAPTETKTFMNKPAPEQARPDSTEDVPF